MLFLWSRFYGVDTLVVVFLVVVVQVIDAAVIVFAQTGAFIMSYFVAMAAHGTSRWAVSLATLMRPCVSAVSAGLRCLFTLRMNALLRAAAELAVAVNCVNCCCVC